MNHKLEVLYYYFYYKKLLHFRSKAKLRAYQKKRLQKHLAFVTAHTPFYRAYEEMTLGEFPIMDKAAMMEHFDRLNTVSIKKEDALVFAMQAERNRQFHSTMQNITVSLSSGTSGSRGIFLISDKEKCRWAGYILAKFLPGSLLGSCSIAFFMRANSNLYEAVHFSKIRFAFFDIFEDMEETIRQLQQYGAQILVGQPSVLLLLADAVKQGRLTIKPQRIISIAEVLEEQDANYIKEAFDLPVIHQVYQCTEGCLASTCEYGVLHLHEDVVYFEKEPVGERRFVPVLTDFVRSSQPIIRYRMNDILIERAEPCRCGSPMLALEKVEGREDDIFLFPGKDTAFVSVFPDFIRRCILFAGEIKDYRVVQTPDGALKIYADIDWLIQDAVRQEFGKLAREKRFCMPEIDFCPYQQDDTKKLKRVECLLQKDQNNASEARRTSALSGCAANHFTAYEQVR